MLIQCFRGADVVPFGRNNEVVYEWKENEKGDFVCNVEDKAHQAALLQSDDVYAIYGMSDMPTDVAMQIARLKANATAEPAPAPKYDLFKAFCNEEDDHVDVLVRLPRDAHGAIVDGTHDLFIDEVEQTPPVQEIPADLLERLDTAGPNELLAIAAEVGLTPDPKWKAAKLRSAIKEKVRLGEVSED